MHPEAGKNTPREPVPTFLSLADPTLSAGLSKLTTLTSYVANTLAFPEGGSIQTTFPDGTANTILFCERYAYQCGQFSTDFRTNRYSVTGPIRRATFTDVLDIGPVVSGIPPVTNSSDPKHRTFQTAPSIGKCSIWMPQTPHQGGMLVAMADGSVRVVTPSISSTTFWSAVTPSGGEILGNDW